MLSQNVFKIAERELRKKDPKLGELIRGQQLQDRGDRGGYFASLARSIMGQQVSTHAAAAIYKRFIEETGETPEAVKNMRPSQTKRIGLSRQKTEYLKDLARHFLTHPDVYGHLSEKTDEEVITELTAVKGIGVWTAQMFLIFTLARPDVFAPDDGGLQRAVQHLYGLDEVPKRSELVRIAQKWSPHRTIASLHLWQSLHNTPQ